MKIHGTTTCPECKQKRSVNNDRRLRWHGAPGAWRGYPACPGSKRQVTNAPVLGGLW